MKIPRALMVEIERLGRLIFEGEMTYEEALDALEPFLHKEEYRLLASDILRKFLRRQLKAWLLSQISTAVDGDESGQGRLPFPDLDPYIEVAVGHKVHQNTMTLKDWDRAVAMAETKALNATGHLERIVRARDRAYEDLKGDQTYGSATG